MLLFDHAIETRESSKMPKTRKRVEDAIMRTKRIKIRATFLSWVLDVYSSLELHSLRPR